jgi:DNA-binding GntR family transcriptional regulator
MGVPHQLSPRRLERPSTVDLLAGDLRREILDGVLPAGARLRERELQETYGVARHSLRAALRSLATEGLVHIEPHRGARVARLTAEAPAARPRRARRAPDRLRPARAGLE